MKPIYKKKVFAKGGNNKAYPINDKFWGYENSNYTSDYKKDVDNIINNNWDAAKKYMTDNNVTYAQTPEGFRSAAFDKKVGTVHEYIKGLSNKSVHNINVLVPKKSTYTHTTDRNFYDSGQFSPEEKALYNPDTLTRDITKEEFDKAMKTNEPVTNSIGAGYRENVQYAKGGNTNKSVTLKDKTNISTNNNSTTFTKPTGQKIVIPKVVNMSSIPNPNSTTQIFTDDGVVIPDNNIRTLNSTSKVLNFKTLKPKYFAGGDTISTGLKAGAGIASMIPGGQFIGAGLGAIGTVVDLFNNNDKQKEDVNKQNALIAAQEQQQLNQLVDTEKINQRNYSIDTPKSSFYAKGGNTLQKDNTNIIIPKDIKKVRMTNQQIDYHYNKPSLRNIQAERNFVLGNVIKPNINSSNTLDKDIQNIDPRQLDKSGIKNYIDILKSDNDLHNQMDKYLYDGNTNMKNIRQKLWDINSNGSFENMPNQFPKSSFYVKGGNIKLQPYINKSDNTRVSPSKIESYTKPNTTSEFIFNPKTCKQEYNPNAQMGLDIVSPEFDILTGIRAAGQGLLDETINNTHKINPWAFKPNSDNLYRGIGKEGAEDAFKSSVLRPKQGGTNIVVKSNSGRTWNMGKEFTKSYYSPKFEIADNYGKGYIAEVSKNAATFRNRYPGKDWSQLTTEQIPITNANILKKNWLMGYKKINKLEYGGNIKPKYATGGELQPLAEDGIAVNGKSHEQGGVDYGDIEVEKGETIKKEADGDFVFSTEFKSDGKNDAGAISKKLFQMKQSLQQKSGLAATEINDGRKELRISPSRIDSNTKGREVTRNQFKQKAIEQQIQQTDTQLEQLKQQQIQWGQEQGIYDKDGNNIIADQPLNQQEQPMAAKGGKFVNGVWQSNDNILYKNNIGTSNNDIINPQIKLDSNFNPTVTGLGTTPNPNFRDTSKDNVMVNNISKLQVSNKKPFNVSAGLDVASTLVNYASNLQTSRNMAKLQTPGYIPIKAIETRRLNMDADRLEATNQEQNYGDWAERNMANPQQAAIIKQSARNQTQQQLGRITQSENTANTQIDEQNASRNLQVQQINQAGAQDYNQRVMNKSISDIQNVSNTNAALLKDVRQGITNQETRDAENRMYELYKLQYKNTPGVARDLGNAMDNTKLTLDEWKKLQATNKPIVRKGGLMKPKYITK